MIRKDGQTIQSIVRSFVRISYPSSRPHRGAATLTSTAHSNKAEIPSFDPIEGKVDKDSTSSKKKERKFYY